MKVKDIMNTSIETVSPEAKLTEVATKLRRLNRGSVLVSEGDRLVGVITDMDIALRCVAEAHQAADTAAKHIMTTDILYCQDTEEVADVAARMSKDNVRSLVVLNAEKKMVGTVLLGDLVVARPEKILH